MFILFPGKFCSLLSDPVFGEFLLIILLQLEYKVYITLESYVLHSMRNSRKKPNQSTIYIFLKKLFELERKVSLYSV